MIRPTKKMRVGTTRLTVRTSNLTDPSRALEQELIVDAGAVYTILPGRLLRQIGVAPDRVRTFELADGRRIEREMGSVRYEFEGESAAAPVIFGRRGGMLSRSFPLPGDGDRVRKLFAGTLADDGMGLGAHRHGGGIRFAYPAAILVAARA